MQQKKLISICLVSIIVSQLYVCSLQAEIPSVDAYEKIVYKKLCINPVSTVELVGKTVGGGIVGALFGSVFGLCGGNIYDVESGARNARRDREADRFFERRNDAKESDFTNTCKSFCFGGALIGGIIGAYATWYEVSGQKNVFAYVSPEDVYNHACKGLDQCKSYELFIKESSWQQLIDLDDIAIDSQKKEILLLIQDDLVTIQRMFCDLKDNKKASDYHSDCKDRLADVALLKKMICDALKKIERAANELALKEKRAADELYLRIITEEGLFKEFLEYQNLELVLHKDLYKKINDVFFLEKDPIKATDSFLRNVSNELRERKKSFQNINTNNCNDELGLKNKACLLVIDKLELLLAMYFRHIEFMRVKIIIEAITQKPELSEFFNYLLPNQPIKDSDLIKIASKAFAGSSFPPPLCAAMYCLKDQLNSLTCSISKLQNIVQKKLDNELVCFADALLIQAGSLKSFLQECIYRISTNDFFKQEQEQEAREDALRRTELLEREKQANLIKLEQEKKERLNREECLEREKQANLIKLEEEKKERLEQEERLEREKQTNLIKLEQEKKERLKQEERLEREKQVNLIKLEREKKERLGQEERLERIKKQ